VVAEQSAATKHSMNFDRTEVTANIWTYNPSSSEKQFKQLNTSTTSTVKTDTVDPA
jgi:hypothetical protein